MDAHHQLKYVRPHQERDRYGQHGDAVGDQSGAWCFNHANLVGRSGSHS
jgi:hypothetical protein